jgi:hypothetical protein
MDFNRLVNKSNVTDPLSSLKDKNVPFRGSPLQLIHTGLAGIFFHSSQLISIFWGIRIDDSNLEGLNRASGFNVSVCLHHVVDHKGHTATIEDCFWFSAAEIAVLPW